MVKTVTKKRGKSGGWNKGVGVGPKRAFTLEQVQLIRATLDAVGDKRELALFETGISTVLRSSDLLSLRVSDVMAEGGVIDSFHVRQGKTQRNVLVSLSDKAKVALAAYITEVDLDPCDKLWKIGRLRHSQLVKKWARMAYTDPRFYSTHSIRRTTPTYIHKETGSHEIPRKLLGHVNLARTATYLGVEDVEAHAIKKRLEM